MKTSVGLGDFSWRYVNKIFSDLTGAKKKRNGGGGGGDDGGGLSPYWKLPF